MSRLTYCLIYLYCHAEIVSFKFLDLIFSAVHLAFFLQLDTLINGFTFYSWAHVYCIVHVHVLVLLQCIVGKEKKREQSHSSGVKHSSLVCLEASCDNSLAATQRHKVQLSLAPCSVERVNGVPLCFASHSVAPCGGTSQCCSRVNRWRQDDHTTVSPVGCFRQRQWVTLASVCVLHKHTRVLHVVFLCPLYDKQLDKYTGTHSCIIIPSMSISSTPPPTPTAVLINTLPFTSVQSTT